MSAEQVAREHYARRRRLSDVVAGLARELWGRLTPDDLDGSWSRLLPQLTIGLTGAQLAAARQADSYTDDVLEGQDVDPEAVGSVVPSSLAGVASDGRPLDSLLLNPVTVVKAGIAGGATVPQSMAAGYANLDMLVRTQLADAGRGADQVAIVARPAATGYVRMLVGRSCSRCVVLAGRRYEWSQGFQRHPRCDCIHVPAAEYGADDIRTDPRAYFEAMSAAEQDKEFTKAGAEAIRNGADIGQVVNARRGMQTATMFGRDVLVTTEGTTVRGNFGRARRNGALVRRDGQRVRSTTQVRLMPEQIMIEADGDRDEAVRLLRLHGYLTAAAPHRPPRAPAEARPPAARRVPAPAPPAAPTLGDRVKAGIVAREVLSGGEAAFTELLTLADGSKVVFKKAKAIEGVPARAQQDAEELVPLVLKAAGLRAPEIYRPTANQLYMEFMQGELASKYRKLPTFRVDPAAYDPDQRWLLGLVDQITDNYDRHGGNFLIGAGREVLGIDHGFAFTFYGSSRPEVPTLAREQPGELFHGQYPNLGKWVDNDMSPADLQLLRERLTALRPEFERVGRGDWHDKMLIRLGRIEQHAKGSKRRIR